jgi:hypothetical protein
VCSISIMRSLLDVLAHPCSLCSRSLECSDHAAARGTMWHCDLRGDTLDSRMGCLQGSLVLAKQCIDAAQVGGAVCLHHGNCAEWRLPEVPDLVVTNPLWGVRQNRQASADANFRSGGDWDRAGRVESSWHELRAFLTSQCPAITAWVLCGDRQASAGLRMRTSRKIPLTLSGVDARLLRYEILPPKSPASDRQLAGGASFR